MLVAELLELDRWVEDRRPCEMEGRTSRRFSVSSKSDCGHRLVKVCVDGVQLDVEP